MKKLLMLIVLLALAGAAGHIYWQRQAKFLELEITQAIDRFNAEVKKETGVTPIEYQSFTLTGFPFSISLVLHQPVLHLPLSYWIRSPAPNITWIEEHRLKGDLIFSADWKVTRYTLKLPGQIDSVSLINGKKVFARQSRAESPLTCSLALNLREAFDKLWQPLATLKLAVENLALIREVNCSIGGYQLASQEKPNTNYQSLSNGNLQLKLDREQSTKELLASLLLKLDSYQAFPANDRYYHSLFLAFPALNNQAPQNLLPLNAMAQYGKQDISVQGNYQGQAETHNWNDRLHLDLSLVKLRNDLFTSSSKIKLDNQPDAQNQQKFTFDIDTTATITPTYEKILQQRYLNELRTAPARIGLDFFQVETALLPPPALASFVTDNFPKLAALSPFTFTAKGNAVFLPPAQPGFYPAVFTIDVEKAHLQNSTWQLDISGKATKTAQLFLPDVDLTVKLQNADVIYAQLANKLITLEKYRQMQYRHPPVLITNPFLMDMKRFVDAIAKGQRENMAAEVTSLGNPSFTINVKGFLPNINGLDLNEIMLLFNELLIPHLSAQSPRNAQPETYQPAP